MPAPAPLARAGSSGIALPTSVELPAVSVLPGDPAASGGVPYSLPRSSSAPARACAAVKLPLCVCSPGSTSSSSLAGTAASAARCSRLAVWKKPSLLRCTPGTGLGLLLEGISLAGVDTGRREGVASREEAAGRCWEPWLWARPGRWGPATGVGPVVGAGMLPVDMALVARLDRWLPTERLRCSSTWEGVGEWRLSPVVSWRSDW